LAFIPRPKPCFLDRFFCIGAPNGEKIWKSEDGKRYYTWDGLHGEIEVFNGRGKHLGVLAADTGATIKPAVKGRILEL
jgi:hypothetical protein